MMALLRWFLARPARAFAAAAVLVVGFLVVKVRLLERARDRAQAHVQQLQLDSTNAIARADTTRLLFQDSLRGVTHLVEQLQVESNARLVAKNREATARADLQLRVDSLQATLAGVTSEDSAGVRHATLAFDSLPFHLRAQLEVPPPPAPTRAAILLSLEPARGTLELACRGREASAQFVGPPWLDLTLERIQQDPRVCAPVQTAAKHPSVVGAVVRGALIGAAAGGVVRQQLDDAALGALIGAGLELLVLAVFR